MHLREYREGDLEYLAEHLRGKEAEILAENGTKLSDVLDLSSLDHLLAMDDGEGNCVALFPMRRVEEDSEPDSVFMWMIGGQALDSEPLAFARAGKGMARLLLAAGPWRRVWSLVAMDNLAYQRWSAWLGFAVEAENVTVPGREGLYYRVAYTPEWDRELAARGGTSLKPGAGWKP